jgi:hypothetical protein
MSHVDEGSLHAYLDGALDEYPSPEAAEIRAHLESCSACAGRLEEERALRGDAHAILGLASPQVDLPGLEELRAFVERTRVRSQGLSTLWRMGWAASVVLALGTGWLVRGQMGAVGRVTAPMGGTSEPVRSFRSSEEGASPSVGAAIASSAEREAPAEPAAARRTDVRGAQSETVEQIADITGAADAVMVMAPAEALAAKEVSLPALSDRSVAPSEVMVSADVVTPPVAPVAGAGAAVAEAVALADAAGSPTREESPRGRSTSSVAMTSAMERSGTPARRPVGEDDEMDSSLPSLVVPGLEVISVTNLGIGSTASGVHVVQRLADGVLVDIWHLEPGVERDVLPARPDGAEEVAEWTDAGWIVLRAATTADAVSRLLAFLIPAGA